MSSLSKTGRRRIYDPRIFALSDAKSFTEDSEAEKTIRATLTLFFLLFPSFQMQPAVIFATKNILFIITSPKQATDSLLRITNEGAALRITQPEYSGPKDLQNQEQRNHIFNLHLFILVFTPLISSDDYKDPEKRLENKNFFLTFHLPAQTGKKKHISVF